MNIEKYDFTVAKRFMEYVKIDTEADPNSTSFPSTMKQKDLANLLVKELLELGVNDAEMDEWGYVYATIPASDGCDDVPVICFCAHMDTAPDCSGKNVKPILHKKYTGDPIVLPDDASQVITIERHPYLKEKIGDDIITASGLTLLGADDKAGVACIMDFARFMMGNPGFKHGKIRILFTPDEEVGRGVDHVDMNKLGADYGYTLDGGVLGSIEDESFSADAVEIKIHGVSAHPGYAKNKMINSLKVAAEFIEQLPKNSWSPETTSGREGFVHPTSVTGIMESTTVKFIIRDHITDKLKEYEDRLEEILNGVVANYEGVVAEFKVTEQYRNMKEVIKDVPFVTDYAIEAMERANVKPRPVIIRGGTDGSRLSFMGMPCPNLFTGEMGIHSKHEYVSVQDMQKAITTMAHISAIWTENN
ncbi:peptidase T [Crocinitomix algicola]|uniref:peptidase T n=1 Tax=Crocinitomix algicola TaxID=1740263 RepID=UPI00082EC339|nr:peptidase T [Crocinitomix algicola]